MISLYYRDIRPLTNYSDWRIVCSVQDIPTRNYTYHHHYHYYCQYIGLHERHNTAEMRIFFAIDLPL